VNFQEQKKTYKLRGGVVIELVQDHEGDVQARFQASDDCWLTAGKDDKTIAALGFPTEPTEAVEDCGEAEEL